MPPNPPPAPCGLRRIARVALMAAAPGLAAGGLPGASAEEAPPPLVREVDRVWAGHPVGFDWLSHGDSLTIAYYDADRRLTVASGRPADGGWTIAHLPSKLGWDSHNGIAMALDAGGRIHLAANMHAVPLVYFRTARPGDVTSFEPLHRMTGDREGRCTYPKFFRGPADELLFSYRDGASGRGDLLVNAYDPASGAWRRLLDGPLLDGEGERNAYPFGPSRGPDGRFHLGWVWRDTPDCATNHDLGYARSADLVHWEDAAGRPLPTPIRLSSAPPVDPVAVGGGLLNLNNSIGFDSRLRPILAYHKHDERGRTQAYTARFEDGAWVVRVASDWGSRWDFSGGGSIEADIRLDALAPAGPGRLAIPFRHRAEGEGRLLLDEATLRPVADAPAPGREPGPGRPPQPAVPMRPEGAAPGLQVHVKRGAGPGGARFALRWETLGPNRDRPRAGPIPDPSPLRLYVSPAPPAPR